MGAAIPLYCYSAELRSRVCAVITLVAYVDFASMVLLGLCGKGGVDTVCVHRVCSSL